MERLSLSDNNSVSTHSRPKAAGVFSTLVFIMQLCFNSQPPEGGWGRGAQNPAQGNRFNSQPPEGGWSSHLICLTIARNRFNSQPPEGGWFCTPECANNDKRFNSQPPEGCWDFINRLGERAQAVSTHSRPKAAGCMIFKNILKAVCFNSQPPEGGWQTGLGEPASKRRFNSQPPEGGWADAGW